MAIRSAHGAGAASAVARVEVLPPDELPAGVPAPGVPERITPAAPRGPKRRGKGRPFDAARAKAIGDKGRAAQKAKREALALLGGLGMRDAQPEALAPYLRDARAFSEAERARLARVVGGGVCEGSAALLVDAAALATAASRAAYAAGDAALGARLSAEARSNLLGAHELCAREAKARPRPQPAWMAELGIGVDTPAATPAREPVEPQPEGECRHSDPTTIVVDEPQPTAPTPTTAPRPTVRFSFPTRTPAGEL